MPIALVAMLAVSAIGAASAAGQRDQAMALANSAAQQISNLGLPPDQAKALIYQQLQAGGHLTPDLEQSLAAENFAPSTVTANAGDTTNLTATLAALKAQSQGGLSPEQMANQQKLLGQTNASTNSQIQGLLNQRAEQGKSDSGNTLAAQLQAIQGGAQQNSQNALQIGAQGQQAQASALSQLMGGQSALRGQDLQTATTNAQMQQQANMFQAQNSAAREARNVGAENAANQSNLNRANQVSDTNTEMANQELLRQQQAQRQYWLDSMNQATSVANAQNGLAGIYMQGANNTTQGYGQLASGVGQAGTAIANANNASNTTGQTSSGYSSSDGSSDAMYPTALGNYNYYGSSSAPSGS